jgi:hypothetical protein
MMADPQDTPSPAGSRQQQGQAEIHYLFRFRDFFTTKTIEEHRKLIGQQGACWWGWWKRPQEDAHVDFWDKLNAATGGERQAWVGLFDSGHDRVYAALVDRIIPPHADPFGRLDQLPLPEGEEALVPAYYRDNSYSRAWLRMVNIILEPIEFFGKFAFGKLPLMANFSTEVAEQLQGTLISEALELRVMDTTVWEVQPVSATGGAQASPLTRQRLLSPGPLLKHAVSRDAIPLQSNLILHLTDPHFAVGKFAKQHVWRFDEEGKPKSSKPSLCEAVSSAIGRDRKIGAVVVTGDLTFMGSEEEFERARKFLKTLLGVFNIDENRLIVIPGNHDICWTKQEEYSDTAEVEVAPPEARKNYEKFYRDLFEHPPNEYLSMGRRFVLPCGLVTEVCALNSSSLAQGKDFLAGMGRIEEQAMQDIAQEFGWERTEGLALRLLAIHHHLALTENHEAAWEYSKGFGIASDAARIMRLAANYGVHLAVHGHKHRAFVWRSSVYELPEHAQRRWRLGDVSIIGGGSVGSSSTDLESNFFNVIEVGSGGLTVEMFRSMKLGIFQPMAKIKGGFRLEGTPPRLSLDDWDFPQPTS